MKCKNCGIEFEGKFCPECATPINSTPSMPTMQAPNPPPQKKKKSPIKIILTVLGIFVAIGIIGSIFGDNDEMPASSNTSQLQTSTVSDEASDEIKTEYGLNDPATHKSTKLTITNVEKHQGSTFDAPKDGMEYVVVTVEYENIGNDRISYNPYDFEMQNSQGQINSQAFTIDDNDTKLGSGELASGGKVSGTIVFEQPVGDTELTLIYTGSLFSSSEKLKFKLQ